MIPKIWRPAKTAATEYWARRTEQGSPTRRTPIIQRCASPLNVREGSERTAIEAAPISQVLSLYCSCRWPPWPPVPTRRSSPGQDRGGPR